MNKSDNIYKMETRLQAQTTFKSIDYDPTNVNGARFIRLVLRLTREDFIKDSEYNLARTIGFKEVRLYGPPKLYKPEAEILVVSCYVCN